MPRGWLTCPVIGDGGDFPLDKAGEPIVTPDRGPFRAAVAEREAVEGDRLEFVIDSKQATCLVAYDVADPSNFAEHGGEILLAEADLDKAADRVAEADKLEALAQEMKVGEAGSAREVLRRVGQKIVPEFDERSYLGEADAPPSGSFLSDQLGGGPEGIAAHSPETGGAWSTSGLEVNVEGGYAVPVTNSYRYIYNAAEPATADYSVETKWLRRSSITGQGGPIMRRKAGEDTHYAVVHFNNTNTTKLVYRVKAAQTTLAEYSFTLNKEEAAVFTISGAGTAIKGYINGVERLSATDGTITEKGVAGARFQAEATGLKLDYIIATDAAPSVVDLEAALSGTGTATGTLTSLTPLSANLSGSGSLGAELRALSSLEAALSGNGALSAELTALVSLEADLSGTGSLEAQLGAITSFAADLSGQGALAAELSALVSFSAELEGEGQLSAELTPIAVFAATLTATGSLTAAFEAARNVPGFMVLVDEARSRAVGGDVAVGRAAVSDRPVLSEET